MERKNFYLLLELSFDPPENNLEIIKAAIKKKQAEWSRNRNHPTKAVLAKQYIGLIPEIRKVMADNTLRRKEAQNAKKILQEKSRKKIAEIDRHIAIHLSKGHVTKEEIFKLARLHSVEEAIIRQRVKKRENEKFAEIEKNIEMRAGKGYITKEEISKLARLHSVSENEIRKRVKCPVKKRSKKTTGKPEPLDKTIEKVINDNLKIIGKSSLYQFLDLLPGSDLKTLQKKAGEKEAELRKFGKKDAAVTAGTALAGQCISIFKTDKSRNAYDLSRAQTRLVELDSDIDVAGMDGKIRAEYFDALVETAVEIGMDRDSAGEYIQEYCRKKKWTVEFKKKKSSRFIYIALFAIILIISAGAGIFLFVAESRKLDKEYQTIMLQVDSCRDMKEKEKILQQFIGSRKAGKFTLKAAEKVKEIQSFIDKKDYKAIVAEGEKNISNGNFEKAITIYAAYQEKYPAGIYTGDIKRKITKIKDSIDDRDFEALIKTAEQYDVERIEAYINYLKNHPNGKHKSDVDKLIADMSKEYYIFTKNAIAKNKNLQNWEKRIQLCSNYISIYKDNKRAVELKKLQDLFIKKLRDEKVFKVLLSNAGLKGRNYIAAKQIYIDFLQSYPDSSLEERIKTELDRLDKKEKYEKLLKKKQKIRKLLKETKGRFAEKKYDVVQDTDTGLSWCLLDSLGMINECIDYESAIEYVKTLKTGGYQDWRLPSVMELVGIYKTEPFFPSGEAKWYWTNENHSRYSNGWSMVVDTITTNNETVWIKDKKDSWECGAVRAVRP